ncbi:MAG: hypothetical protein AAFY85_10620, partial [Pseudomonadota bacterium]
TAASSAALTTKPRLIQKRLFITISILAKRLYFTSERRRCRRASLHMPCAPERIYRRKERMNAGIILVVRHVSK